MALHSLFSKRISHRQSNDVAPEISRRKQILAGAVRIFVIPVIVPAGTSRPVPSEGICRRAVYGWYHPEFSGPAGAVAIVLSGFRFHSLPVTSNKFAPTLSDSRLTGVHKKSTNPALNIAVVWRSLLQQARDSRTSRRAWLCKVAGEADQESRMD